MLYEAAKITLQICHNYMILMFLLWENAYCLPAKSEIQILIYKVSVWYGLPTHVMI